MLEMRLSDGKSLINHCMLGLLLAGGVLVCWSEWLPVGVTPVCAPGVCPSTNVCSMYLRTRLHDVFEYTMCLDSQCTSACYEFSFACNDKVLHLFAPLYFYLFLPRHII